jgi:putative ABC transport system permease protein
MKLHPILSAMRRNKIGALLIAVQIAVTLAILCNAVFIIHHRLAWTTRPTGVDEQALFVVKNERLDRPSDLAARMSADVAALRALPGVVDAFPTNSYPLATGGWAQSIQLRSDQTTPSALTAYYFGDERALHTLGLRLVAGRNFTATEIIDRNGEEMPAPSGFIITRALAEKLFPGGDALGKSLYIENPTTPTPVIGIVERLQAPFTSATGAFSTQAENSVLAPYRLVDPFSYYIVRTQPGRLAAVMQAAERELMKISRARILRLESLPQARLRAYRDDRALALALAAVSLCLLIVTAAGIGGLTSYWVSQRRQQIGIRRAVGATRLDIVKYFQAENLMIAVLGAAVGAGLALALNVWIVNRFAFERLPLFYMLTGTVIVLALGQLAALWPALRASRVPPAIAARSL